MTRSTSISVSGASDSAAIRCRAARGHRVPIRRNAETPHPVHAGRVFRKFGISYANLHPMRDEVRHAFINAKDTQAILEILAVWYASQREWPASTRAKC
jgi:hypothetical protein